MANYYATARTNYFRVTDENKYTKLFTGLTSECTVEDFSKEVDGVLYHGFGSYDTIAYWDEEKEEFNFDLFLEQLQKILPDDEAFIYMEAGYEKLRYVNGFCIVVTNKEIKTMYLDEWAKMEAKSLLGENFTTQTDY